MLRGIFEVLAAAFKAIFRVLGTIALVIFTLGFVIGLLLGG